MDFEEIIMNIIINGGSARSHSMEAIHYAKIGNFPEARLSLIKAEDDLLMAHNVQTSLIQNEASGNKIEVSLLMVHAQDHLMNAITIKDIAQEFVDMYEKFFDNK
ncbi:MAG: phosphotransferase system cellobiose-specific component [Bacillota bacterium]|jgi:PTS system cellobiose-specific IIA component|nr:phosphotransferase system cellobiose-specific component [Bacillota bacterium]